MRRVRDSFSGTVRCVSHGKLHNPNGPAIIWENGDKEWWVNGQLHRIDGPAVVKKVSSPEKNCWYFHGEYLGHIRPACLSLCKNL